MSTKSTSHRGSTFARVRLVVLLLLVAGSATLLTWSRQHDPRFYWFVQSAPGSLLADALGWQTGTRPHPPDEDPDAWTPEEQAALKQLHAQLDATTPDTELALTDGRVLRGFVVEETPEHLLLEVKYDTQLGVRMKVDASQVVRRTALARTRPPISRRDVQFHLEFPGYGFYRRPPYTIITDRGAFEAEDAVAMLQQLHATLEEELQALVQSSGIIDGIQLLFFSDEAAYKTYVDDLAPHLEFSSGFYSPSEDRLVWFDQAGSFQTQAIREHIDAAEAHHQQRARHPQHHQHIRQSAQRARRHLSHAVDIESRRVLRHEGAHQLFFTLGVHSEHYAENPWLLEGLAQYFEELLPGRIPSGHADYLLGPLQADDPLSVERLLTLRSIRGLHELEDPELITTGYVRSAAIVRWLMHRERRVGFAAWLQELRDRRQVWRAATADQVDWLADHLNLTREELLERLRVEAFAL